MTVRFVVLKAGVARIQDAGRRGFAHLGVPRAGAADQFAYRAALALAGHTRPAPAIEITATDFACTATHDLFVAVTGAPCTVCIDDDPVPMWAPVHLRAGRTLTIRRIRQGLHVYVGVSGWLDTPRPLGSAAWDEVMGWGMRLQPGSKLALHPSASSSEPAVRFPADAVPRYGTPWTVRVCPGPDTGRLGDLWDRFLHATYRVDSRSNAIGKRLLGPRLENRGPSEVLSRGAAVGAVEWLPSGLPLVLLRNRGVTAGYPILGVVASVDLDAVSQARPMDALLWQPVTVSDARHAYRDRWARLPAALRCTP
ncbi:MAG: allophanate hydrolase [Actinomycetia bacterium]|nr:allophanate hydrolase [Actinomycetes bacterium]